MSTVPADLHRSLATLSADPALDAQVNSFAWTPERRTLTIFHHEDGTALKQFMRGKSDGVNISYVETLFSKSELSAEAARIARLQTTADGRPISFAAAATDGSGVLVGIDGDVSASLRSIITPVPSTFPVQFEESDAFSVSRQIDQSPFWGGARISKRVSSPAYYVCTSGFSVGRNLSGGGITTGMLTAHHCAAGTVDFGGTGDTWRTGIGANNPIVGRNAGAPMNNSDIKLLTTAEVPVNHQGYVYMGARNSTAGQPVRGVVAPVVGDSWCFSGHRTGQVCLNSVQQTEVSTCYQDNPPLLLCYDHQVLTQQVNRQASVGNGDSGGPGLVLLGNNAGVLAASIISGMRGQSESVCIGDPGGNGRACSDVVLSAPVTQFLSANPGWGVLARR